MERKAGFNDEQVSEVPRLSVGKLEVAAVHLQGGFGKRDSGLCK